MAQPYWLKQTADAPLFPDLLWSRPENKRLAGKLGIIGGNVHGFAAPAQAQAAAEAAGAGLTRVVLPQHVKSLLPRGVLTADFAPGTPSGSFARSALAELLVLGQWADGLLLAGDLGRNSETAIVLEQLAEKYHGQLTLTQDALDYFTATPAALLNRPDTLAVASFAQAQKLFSAARWPRALTFSMDLTRLVEALHEFAGKHALALIVKHHDTLAVAVVGQVSTIKVGNDLEAWRVPTAAAAATWWLQNPGQPFAALSSAVLPTKL
jgi:NAD(P)H-hydrate repair Nnr-like enzyme with NAD(P)H-hydrate dehydratase domain